VIAYSSSSTKTTVAASSASFFDNTHLADCGAITSCALYASGCSTAYTTGNLVIDSTTGEITAKQNVDAGYTDTVCVKCENTATSSVSFDTWVVQQKANCKV